MDEKFNPFRSTRLTQRQIKTYNHLETDNQLSDDNQKETAQSLKSAKFMRTDRDDVKNNINRKVSHSPISFKVGKGNANSKPKYRASLQKQEYYALQGKLDGKDEDSNHDFDSQKETIKVSMDKMSRYYEIAALTEQQNQNLKQQNKYLLEKLRKMRQREQKMKKIYNKAKFYKTSWAQTKQQISIVKQQTYIYRDCIQDLKQIAMIDIPTLKKKVEQTQNQVKQQILQAIKQSKNMHRKNRKQEIRVARNSHNEIGEIKQQTQEQSEQKTITIDSIINRQENSDEEIKQYKNSPIHQLKL